MGNVEKMIQALGIDTSREFQIKDENGNEYQQMFSEDGELLIKFYGNWRICTDMINMFNNYELMQKWMPERGSKYYAHNAEGMIDRYTYQNDKVDIYNLKIGNCFKTREEAEQYELKVVKKSQSNER